MKCESREKSRTPLSSHPLLTHRSRRQGHFENRLPTQPETISWTARATLITLLKKIILSGSQYVIKFLYTQFKLLNDFPGLLFIFWSCSSSWQCSVWNFAVDLKWSIWQNSFQTHSTGNTMNCLSQNLTYHKWDKKQTVKVCHSLPPFLESGVTNAFPVLRYGNCLVQTSAFCWS